MDADDIQPLIEYESDGEYRDLNLELNVQHFKTDLEFEEVIFLNFILSI